MSSSQKRLILASSSPRRQHLMEAVGFSFSVIKPDVDESFPPTLPADRVARYLAEKKAACFDGKIKDEVVVTADTVVILDGEILNKPADRNDACAMLVRLAGKKHTVMTGVCIATAGRVQSFDETTHVTFESLSSAQIAFYVDNFRPYDKAGAYGAQDCLPAGMNPCSAEEVAFLTSIGRGHIVRETLTPPVDNQVTIIKQIDGSYFNVMGLPIHRLYHLLQEYS